MFATACGADAGTWGPNGGAVRGSTGVRSIVVMVEESQVLVYSS